MAEQATVLDIAWLRGFIRDHVEDFVAELEKIRKDSKDGVKSMDSLGGMDTTRIMNTGVLKIGAMGGGGESEGSDLVGGGELNDELSSGAELIDELLKRHHFLFQDLKDALEATIDELGESQSANLEQLSMDDFMDIFEDLDLSSGSGGGGGGRGGDDDD